MKKGKKGQFFILAAVIISAIVVSFAFTANEARVNEEPENFKDLSYEVKKETGAVMDYQIYSNFNDDANLTQFVDMLANDLYEKDQNVSFMFIYGNTSNVTIRNYSPKAARVNEGEVRGGTTLLKSIIRYQDYYQTVEETQMTHDPEGTSWTGSFGGAESVDVEINGQKYPFKMYGQKQVIFIIQKDVGDENYISVK
jgi:ABC-type Fe3+ transport system substrate-binding protein